MTTYQITIKGGYIRKFLSELKAWGVKESLYQTNGNVVTTKNTNVVDVATETFFRQSAMLEIKEMSENGDR